MSLQAWYPFNGDYENQGLGDLDLTVTTSPSYTFGKVTNQGLSSGGFKWSTEQSSKILNNKALSICFWIKVTSAASAGGGMLFGQHSPNRRFCIFTYPNFNDLHLDWRYNDSGSSFYNTVETGFFATNQWTHCTLTFEYPNSLKIYKNGILYKTVTGNGTMNFSSFAYETLLSFELANRYINDFRVYDHCLSPKEVKEISKGLMLHYPLDNNGFGCKNLLAGNFNAVATQEGNTHSGSLWIHTDNIGGSFNNLIGKTLVFSYEVSAEGSRYYVNTGDLRPRFGIHGTIQYVANGSSATYYPFANYLEYSGGARKVVMKYTIPSTWTSISNFTFALQDTNRPAAGNTSTWYIKNCKLEIADEATPWCPNEADELYSQLGMDENIEYDTSGYRNNGTKVGALDYEANSPRYNCSSYLNGTDAYIQAPKISLDMNNVTVSMWFNVKARSAYMRLFDFGSAAGGSGDEFVLELYGTAATELSAYITGTSSEQIFTGYNLSNLNTWYHVACTTSNGTVKIYVNGNLVKTANGVVATRVFNLVYNYIGKSNWADPLSNCRVSDFRIYATCLSDSDIQELYNKPISIDNQGNIFVVEAVEESATGSQFIKTGVVKAEDISLAPIQDMEIKTLDDGSAWARILHHNNKSGTVVFTSSNVMNIQSTDLYSRLYLLENFRDVNGAFEFMAIQPEISDKIYRWKQTNNPTKSGAISGYVNVENGLGGLVYGPTTQTLMSVSGTTSNWWCAVGCYVNYNNGLPGFDQKIVNQTLDFYVRIDTLPKNNKFNIYNKFIECEDIIEN